jgi:beta-lactamase regulating signal transducer with metallopeptidase domain
VAGSNAKFEVADGETVSYGATNAVGKNGGAIATISWADRLARVRELAAGAKPYVLMVWLIGMFVLALRIGWSSVRLARAVARMTPILDPLVLESLRGCCRELKIFRMPAACELPGNGAPALVGFWRPRILLPRHVLAAMAGEELRLILLHELAHLKRRDVLVNWIATVIAVIHWFNPAAWLVGWRMRVERELACDELVLRMGRDGSSGNVYARTIVKLVEALSSGDIRGRVPVAIASGAVGILEGKAQIQRRLVMIARFDAKSRRWPVVAAGFGLLFGALALSGVTRAADKTEEKAAGAAAATKGGAGNPLGGSDTRGEKAAAKTLSGFVASPPAKSKGTADDPANARAAEKLTKTLQKVDFPGVALGDALDFIRDAVGVDIMVEWPALEQIGVTRDTPVTLRLHEPATADAVLSLMFRAMGGQLQHEIDKGVVVVSPSHRETATIMRVYDVSDLIGEKTTAEVAEPGKGLRGIPALSGARGGGNGSEQDQLVTLITTTIEPEGWAINGGGVASIGVFKQKMVVKAPENVQKEVEGLLEALRAKPAAAAQKR